MRAGWVTSCEKQLSCPALGYTVMSRNARENTTRLPPTIPHGSCRSPLRTSGRRRRSLHDVADGPLPRDLTALPSSTLRASKRPWRGVRPGGPEPDRYRVLGVRSSWDRRWSSSRCGPTVTRLDGNTRSPNHQSAPLPTARQPQKAPITACVAVPVGVPASKRPRRSYLAASVVSSGLSRRRGR